MKTSAIFLLKTNIFDIQRYELKYTDDIEKEEKNIKEAIENLNNVFSDKNSFEILYKLENVTKDLFTIIKKQLKNKILFPEIYEKKYLEFEGEALIVVEFLSFINKLLLMKDKEKNNSSNENDEKIKEQKEEIKKEIKTIEKEIKKEENIKKSPFKFSDFGIEPGEELVFSKNEKIKVTVAENNKVKYKNETYSISKLANILLGKDPKSSIRGTEFFLYNGEKLSDIYDGNSNSEDFFDISGEIKTFKN